MSVPEQQKTLHLTSVGGPLTIQTTPVPKPGPDDVLVKIEAAGLNPLEAKIQDTGIFIKEWPTVLGFEGAGTVVVVGANVTDFKVGDRVIAQGWPSSQTGTYQEYFTAPAAVTIKIPASISFDEGATIPIGAGTAGISLYNKGATGQSIGLVAPWLEGGRSTYAGKPTVVLGGSSSVGQYAIQFLKHSGFSPIITTVSPRNTELVKSLGATHVLDRTLPASTIASEVAKIAGAPVEVVYDAISEKDTQDLAYDIIAPNGLIALVLPETIDEAKKADGKKPTVTFAQGGLAYPQNLEFSKRFVKELSKLLESGEVKPNIPEVLPGGLDGVQGGIDRLRANAVSARKLVVRPAETA